MKPPFEEGQTVRIKGEDHLGLHRIESCEWFVPGPGGAAPYWLCKCSAIREPIDWSNIPEGANGIIVGSGYQCSSDRLIAA
jgi:hypothetical protein